jgi:hypothetical protein
VARDEAALLWRHLLVVVVHDVEQRLVNLAYVVEQGDALDAADGGLIEVCRAREGHAVRGDTADVRTGHRVIRIDGVEQRLERRGGEAPGSLRLAALSNEECADPGAEGETKRRSHDSERGKNGTVGQALRAPRCAETAQAFLRAARSAERVTTQKPAGAKGKRPER